MWRLESGIFKREFCNFIEVDGFGFLSIQLFKVLEALWVFCSEMSLNIDVNWDVDCSEIICNGVELWRVFYWCLLAGSPLLAQSAALQSDRLDSGCVKGGRRVGHDKYQNWHIFCSGFIKIVLLNPRFYLIIYVSISLLVVTGYFVGFFPGIICPCL